MTSKYRNQACKRRWLLRSKFLDGWRVADFRRIGVAKALADYQEKWAHNQAYDQIVFKTRNVHKAMLIFALQNGFEIIRVDTREPIAQNRIWLRKQIR